MLLILFKFYPENRKKNRKKKIYSLSKIKIKAQNFLMFFFFKYSLIILRNDFSTVIKALREYAGASGIVKSGTIPVKKLKMFLRLHFKKKLS